MASIVQGGSILPSSYANVTEKIQHTVTSQLENFASKYVAEIGFWKIAITILLALAVYDQCKSPNRNTPFFPQSTDTLAGSYIIQKGSIAGPSFKLPFIGPFIQAIHPKWEGYIEQWDSGPLSCVSIFHK